MLGSQKKCRVIRLVELCGGRLKRSLSSAVLLYSDIVDYLCTITEQINRRRRLTKVISDFRLAPDFHPFKSTNFLETANLTHFFGVDNVIKHAFTATTEQEGQYGMHRSVIVAYGRTSVE